MRFPVPTLALALLLAAPPAPALSVAPPAAGGLEALSHSDLVLQHDADGGMSLRALIDDHPDGSYSYTAVDASNLNRTLAGLLRPLGRTLGEELARTLTPVEQVGVYEHRWTRQWSATTGSPMLTLGVFAKPRDQGALRLPLLLLENVTSVGNAVAVLSATVLNDAPDTLLNLVPFLLEFADPTMQDHFGQYPVPDTQDSYADRPPVYAWLVRRGVPRHEVWLGLYAERFGSVSGSNASGQSLQATKTIDVGFALRLDRSPVLHIAGAFMRHDIEKRGTNDTQDTRSFFTAGASSLKGRTPLAAMEGHDARRDLQGTLSTTPDHQETGFSVGTSVDGTYVPLLGAHTVMKMRPYACPAPPAGQPSPQQQCLAVERLTSLGVYVQGRYLPLAGFHYRGSRNLPVPWLSGLASGGGPGAQSMGEFDLDIGAFANGQYAPLAGVQYRDRFEGGQRPFQGMLTAGLWGPAGYQPLLGVTYDGERPLLTWAQAYAAANRTASGSWLASAGTFVGARYVPLLGLRYQNSVAGSSYQDQQHFTLGVFAGRFEAFLPLVTVAYDGDEAFHSWASTFATTGTLGGSAGSFNLRAGSGLVTRELPLVGVQYRTDYGSGWARQSFLTVGAYGPFGFVPVVGMSYSGEDHLVGSLNSPTSTTDDDHAYVTVGVFVQGQYVPLLGLTNGGEGTALSLLPPWY